MADIVDDITVKVLELKEENKRLKEVVGELVNLIGNIESALPSGLESWISYEEYEELLAKVSL